MEDNNALKKSLLSIFLFIVLVILVFYFVFKENSFKQVINILQSSNKLYLLIGIFCMSFFSICEALNIKRTLVLLKNKVKFRDAYKYALGGYLLASITPSSSGGDPMQLYLMTKDKISVGHAAITLLVKLLIFQFVVIILSILGFIFSYPLIDTTLGSFKYLIYLGILLNCLVFVLYFFVIFCKPIITFLIEIVVKLLHKIHYKKTEKIKEKIEAQVLEFDKASNYLKKNKTLFIKNIITTVFQMLAFYSIPYYVYLAFGFHEHSILTFLSIQAVLFVSVSSLPFPGAVGISEITFLRLYKTLFLSTILGSAMIVTRFINFYMCLIYSTIMVVIYITIDNYKRRKS